MSKSYMIRRTTDGLFSMGGGYPDFKPNGKVWKRIGDLHSHLNLVNPTRYADCEIVICSLQVEEVIATNIPDYIERRTIDKKRQEQLEREAANKANLDRQVCQAKDLLRSLGETL